MFHHPMNRLKDPLLDSRRKWTGLSVVHHIVGHLIRSTRSSALVLSGGTALNGIATMRLLEHFDEAYYERYLGMKQTRLRAWTPPVPRRGRGWTPLAGQTLSPSTSSGTTAVSWACGPPTATALPTSSAGRPS